MAAMADAFSSLCVGGTFMVVTLAVIQEARRVAPANSASLIATMTAAFAIDQNILDSASRVFVDVLGDWGEHARAAFSVEQLPLNAPIELVVTFALRAE